MYLLLAFVDGIQPSHSPMECDANSAYSHEETRQMFSCEICNIDLKGKIQYEDHLKRKRHARMIKHLKNTSQILDVYEKKLKSDKESDQSNLL